MEQNKNIGMLQGIGSSFVQLLKYVLMIDDYLLRYTLMRQVVYLICYTIVESITLQYQCDDKLKEVVHDICTFQKEHKIFDLENEDVLRVLMLINDLCDILQLSQQEGYTAFDSAFCVEVGDEDNVDVMCDYIVTAYINSLISYESKADNTFGSDFVYDFK